MELNSFELLQADCNHLRQALAARDAESETLRQQIVELGRKLKAFERDRQLLGWEIHDGLVQEMTAAAMFLSTVERQVEKDGTFVPETLRRGMEQVRKSIQEARQLIGSITPANAVNQRGLVAAVEEVIARFREQHTIAIEFCTDTFPEKNDYHLEWTVRRIVQEALANAARHSKSARIEVQLASADHAVLVTIRDFGIGFDPTVARPNHFGLESIRERAKQYGGSATIDSEPGEGATVIARLPLTPCE